MSRFFKKINTKPVVILLTLLFLILAFLFFRQYQTSHSIDQEVADLQRQAEMLQKNNKELESFITYFQTDNYQEKVAREQLSVKKEGEFVYSFADLNTQIAPAENSISENQNVAAAQNFSAEKKESNVTKWWQYFFGVN